MVGRSLLNHTIISLVLDSMDICELRCFLEHDCVSINFGAENDGGNRCELSDSDHIVHPGDFKNREGFIYRSVEVSFYWSFNSMQVLHQEIETTKLAK